MLGQWPLSSLTGFRDPYIFSSPFLASLPNANFNNATGSNFLTISGGVHGQGPRLFLYRQTSDEDVRGWTYVGVLVSLNAGSTFSSEGWSGNFGINFETASVTRLNEQGESLDPHDTTAVDFLGLGTEGGRGGHEGHWPLCESVVNSAGAF